MNIPKKISGYLEKNRIAHELLEHKIVYTAYDAAKTLKAKIELIVKPLLVKVDKRYVVVAVPAHYNVDLEKVRKLLKAKKVELAKEKIMTKVFKTKPGAMTAFGSVYGLEVVMDRGLSKLTKAIFSAGSFTQSLQLKLKDYIKVEHPTVGVVGKKRLLPKIKPPAPVQKRKRAKR